MWMHPDFSAVELTFLICRIDLFDPAGTHVDMHPYLVANITISNVDKLKIMDTVSSVPTNPATGHQSIWSPYVPSLLRPYLCPVWFWTPYLSYELVLPHATVFPVETSVDMPLCMTVSLVETYGHRLPFTLVLAVETYVHVIMQASVHVLPLSSLLVLPCVYFSMHVILRESVHVPPR